jgi:hypothetical protein
MKIRVKCEVLFMVMVDLFVHLMNFVVKKFLNANGNRFFPAENESDSEKLKRAIVEVNDYKNS